MDASVMHLHPINLIGTAVLLDTVKHVYVSVYVSHSNVYLKFNRGILSIVLQLHPINSIGWSPYCSSPTTIYKALHS